MIKAILQISMLFAGLEMARAESFRSFLDGQALWAACESDPSFAYGIVAGIHDALSEAFSKTGDKTLQVCAPDGGTIASLKKAICDDLGAYPFLRNMSAVQAVWSSMLVRNPC